jgi:Flp pilus assembly CpaF family ATPase
MVHMGGMILDAQTPRVDSYTGDGTRISAMIPPVVPQERGVIASIRRQKKAKLHANSFCPPAPRLRTCWIF